MSEMVDIIKQMALEAVEAKKPCEIAFGVVNGTEPLVIAVDQKLILSEDMLVLTSNVSKIERDITISMNTDARIIDKLVHSHNFNGTTKEYEYYDEKGKLVFTHNHSFSGKTEPNIVEDISHNHSITGLKKIIVHNELKPGEVVLLLRCNNGQKYVVLDRINDCSCKGEWLNVT